MHSRIFGIVPLVYYDENMDMDTSWEFHFADYTRRSTSLDSDVAWLRENLLAKTTACGGGGLFELNLNDHTIKFYEGFKEVYFKEKWEMIVNLISFSKDAFKKFCGYGDDFMFIHTLKKSIEEEFGFYICDDCGAYSTLDEFIRNIEYGKTYKIFGSLDYHF